MEIEDYGFIVKIIDSYSKEQIGKAQSLNLPIVYPNHPCSYAIELNQEINLLASFKPNITNDNGIICKISVWGDGSKFLESQKFEINSINKDDLRELILSIAAPLLLEYHAHFSNSFRTHFESLAQWLNYPLCITPKVEKDQ